MKFDGVISRLYGGTANDKRKKHFYYDVQIILSDWCPLKDSVFDKEPLFKGHLETNLLYAWMCTIDGHIGHEFEEARRWTALCVAPVNTPTVTGLYNTATNTNFIYGKIRYSHNVVKLDKFMKWKRMHVFV